MNLHEFQAKQLFSQYQIPIPKGQMVTSGAQARPVAEALGGDSWVVKAQVHSGGRGKAGGVKVVSSVDEVTDTAYALLGERLVTQQTGKTGLPINQVLIELPSDIDSELYLAILVDRTSQRVAFMISAQGGMDIETVAQANPEAILTLYIDPVVGLQAYQCRRAAFFLGLVGDLQKQLTRVMQSLYQLFIDNDVNLVEVNPLVVTKQHQLLALDAKLNLDENALFRHSELAAMFDPAQEDEAEVIAKQHGLNYITLEGNVACMVNGAGLAMATMDLVQLHGGMPANFLDVGGGTTKERVAHAFKLILADSKVSSILVNIFGGIVRCDLIAAGILQAAEEVGMHLPLVVRLEGTHAEQGRQLLTESNMAITVATDLTDAAKQAVLATQGESA